MMHGRKILGIFEPKDRSTLRPEALPLIGREFEFVYNGTNDDDHSFPGQTTWVITEKHHSEIPEEMMYRWFPAEDIKPSPDPDPTTSPRKD